MLLVTVAVIAGGVGVAALVTWFLGLLLFGTLPGTWVPGPATGAAGDEGWLALVKVALTVAAGAGAAVALVVAYRRQRLAEKHEPRREADEQRAIAAAQRDTEKAYLDQYRGAVEQLGHSNATVRMAGVYALANLADAWPARRQQCVDVLCAHLRTPWLADELEGTDGRFVRGVVQRQETGSTDGLVTTTTYPDRSGEGEVRATILRVIGAHLMSDEARALGEASWSSLVLDLADAHLPAFTWVGCMIGPLSAQGATFTGEAEFSRAVFTGHARFEGATFTGAAGFWNATFLGVSRFEGATFLGLSMFKDATFKGAAGFGNATFKEFADFGEARFTGAAGFWNATFFGAARFERATFNEFAGFGRTTFTGDAGFGLATFSGVPGFALAALIDSRSVAEPMYEDAGFEGATFTGRARFEGATFTGRVGFDGVKFNVPPEFKGATFKHGAPGSLADWLRNT